MSSPVRINIVNYPLKCIFKMKSDRFFFDGLLCKVYYDDGTSDFLFGPYVEIPDFKYPGVYKVNIYLDENKCGPMHRLYP